MRPVSQSGQFPATIVDVLSARAKDSPDKIAFIIEGESLTYEQLRDDASWLASRLRAARLEYGARCGIMLPSSLDFVRTVYAAQYVGAIPVAIDPSLAPSARDSRLRLVTPGVVVTTNDLADRLRAGFSTSGGPVVMTMSSARSITPEPSTPVALYPEGFAYLQFTSGTTGAPHACAVSHRALMAALAAMRDRFEYGSSDVLANWLPLHYASGLIRHVFGTISYGCCSHLIRPSAASPARWLRLISDVKATATTSPDFAYRVATGLVSPTDVNLRSLRLATNGGEAVRRSTVEDFEKRFGLSRVIQPAYGLSEGSLAVTGGRPGDPLVTDSTGNVSCGPALPGVQVRIVDEAGVVCDPDVVGNIQFRGDLLFSGYFGEPAATSEVMKGDWCQPGDAGTMDRAGRLYVRARTRAMIKRGGACIAPRDIEEAVERLDGVRTAAAIGVSRAIGTTDDIVVVVEVDEGVRSRVEGLAQDVQRTAADAVGVMPRSVVIVPRSTIPRTASGKVRHAELVNAIGDPEFLRRAYFAG